MTTGHPNYQQFRRRMADRKRRAYRRDPTAYIMYAELTRLLWQEERVERMKECECGCGTSIPTYTVRGEPQRYAQGHISKVRWRNKKAA